MAEFASRWPDVRLWAITRVNGTVSDAHASAERHGTLSRQVVVSAVPQQMVTVVSRAYLVTVEAWDATSKKTAQDLAQEAAFQIESAPRDCNPVVTAELNAGPNENRDPDSGVYSYDVTVLVVVHRLP
jgi:hypothetical protein